MDSHSKKWVPFMRNDQYEGTETTFMCPLNNQITPLEQQLVCMSLRRTIKIKT